MKHTNLITISFWDKKIAQIKYKLNPTLVHHGQVLLKPEMKGELYTRKVDIIAL